MTMPETPGGGRDDSAVGTEQVLPDAGTSGGAREQVRQAKDKVMDQARTTLRDARDRAGSTFAQSRRQAADQIGGIGGAFRRTGEALRGEEQTRFADVADNVAGQMDRVADYLRESDGRIVDQGVVTATSGTGERGTFDFTTKEYEIPFDGVGALFVYELSAKDGSRINLVEIPVRMRR